jgi:hypothetical protein
MGKMNMKRTVIFLGMALLVSGMMLLSGCNSDSAPLAPDEAKKLQAPAGSNEMPAEAKAAMERARQKVPQGAPTK